MSHNTWRRWVSRLFQQKARSRVRSQRSLHLEPLEDRVVPTTDNWTGGGFNGLASSLKWSIAANWSAGVPVAGEDLVFGTSAAVARRNTIDDLTLSGGGAYNSITVSSTGYTLGGANPIVLKGAFNVGSNLSTITVAPNLQLTPPASNLVSTITVNTGSDLVLQGQLSGGATVAQQTLLKAGTGTLELQHDNSTWTGAVTLANSGGIVVMTNANSLGTGAAISGAPNSGITTVNTNAQIQLENVAAPITERLKVNGSGIVNDGAILDVAGNATWNASIEMDSDSTFGAAVGTTLTIPSVISDLGAGHNLTKEGFGTLVFSHVGGNTYRGTTTVNNGVLIIQDPLSLGAGADATKSQSGTPQSETIVNYNPTSNEIGTLEINYNPGPGLGQTAIPGTDPNALLQNPALPFNAATNPVVGFQVFNDILVLNGPGFTPGGGLLGGALGAVYNAAGNNGWDGTVTLGSPPPELDGVNVGVAANTTLMVSGVVNDVNRVTTLNKILPGELILNDADTYRGGTIVETGALNIRDSQALGTAAATVMTGATLELQVDQGLDGTPLRTHNRNLGFDSVNESGPGQEVYVNGTTGTFTLSLNNKTSGVSTTGSIGTNPVTLAAAIASALNGPTGLLATAGYGGTATVTQDGNVYRVIFGGALLNANIPLMTATPSTGGPTVAVNNIYGLTVANSLDTLVGPSLGVSYTGITGNGLASATPGGFTGALDSISGINTYTGNIDLNGTFLTPAKAAIGVQTDPRTAHFTADANYFQWDNSLTIQGTISHGDLVKVGGGNLILPNANTYGDTTGTAAPTTDVKAGWITVRNDQSLGTALPPSQTNIPQTLEPYATVENGTAIQLKPLVAGTSLTLYYNFVLTGVGINHPYGLINEAGAIENLDGDNFLAGILQLNGVAGIGVEQIPPSPPILPPLTASELILTGDLWNYTDPATGVVATGGLTKLGSRRLIIQGAGTFTGPVDVSAGVLLDQNDTALGGGNAASVPTVTVESGTSLEFGNSINGENVGNGIVSENGGIQGGIEVWGEHLILNGSGDPTFDDSAINVLASNVPVIAPEVQTITVTGSLASTYTLSFTSLDPTNHVVTDVTTAISATATAAQVQAALQALPNIGGMGGIVTVTESGNVYQITFGGTMLGYNEPTLVATGSGDTVPVMLTTLDGTTLGMLAPANDPIVPTDDVWRGPITLNSNTTVTANADPLLTNAANPSNPLLQNPDSRMILAGSIDDASNPSPSGSNLTILGGGEVDLDGVNTYHGTTYINQGVVTIGSNQALGNTDLSEIQQLTLSGVPDGARAFTLTFTGFTGITATTGPIAYQGSVGTGATPDALAIQNALNALTNVGGGNSGGSVTVTQTATGVFQITFGGTLSGFQQNLLTGTAAMGTISATDNAAVAPGTQVGAGGTVIANGASLQLAGSFTVAGKPLILEGNGSTSSVQNVTVNATSGSFTLSYTGPNALGNVVTDTTDPVNNPLNVTSATLASDIQAALDNLSNVGGVNGSVSVTQAGNVYSVTFGGALANQNLQIMAVTPSVNVGGNVTIQTLQLGGSTISHVPTQWFQAGPAPTSAAPLNTATITVLGTSGTFTVSYNGDTTGALAYNAPANGGNGPTGSLANALAALPTIGGVTGGAVSVTLSGNVYTITMLGALAGQKLQFSATGSGGATAIANSTGITQTDGQQAVSGRITSEAVDPNDPTVLYVGTAGGGVWKSIDNGVSWHPIFDAIPEIQTVTVTATSGTFTLSFTGADDTGTMVTDTTDPIDVTSTTLAADIQAALDSLANIGGIGALVTVTQSGTAAAKVFTLTFGGTLAGNSLQQTSVTSSVNGGTVTAGRLEAGSDSKFALYVGAVAIDPTNSNIIYVGTGEADNATDNFYGTGIYKSTDGGTTWGLVVDTVTNPGQVINPFYAMGVNKIAIDPDNPGDIYVADGSQYTDGVLNGTPTSANTSVMGGTLGGVIEGVYGTPGVGYVAPGGTGQLPGVWRFSTTTPTSNPAISTQGTWFDMTIGVSNFRANLVGQQKIEPNPPQTPGPDDDFRLRFPEAGDPNAGDGAVDWSDVSVIDTIVANDGAGDPFTDPVVPEVYAALGTANGNPYGTIFPEPLMIPGSIAAFGTPDNAIFRTRNPQSDQPTWFIGDPGVPVDQVETITFTLPALVPASFTLGFNGASTVPLLYASQQDMTQIPLFPDNETLTQNLNDLSTIGGGGIVPPGSVGVVLTSQTATVSVYTVTFGGSLGFSPQPLFTHTQSSGLSISVKITVPGGGADKEKLEFPTPITVSGAPPTGNIKLAVAQPALVPGSGLRNTESNVVVLGSVADPGTNTDPRTDDLIGSVVTGGVSGPGFIYESVNGGGSSNGAGGGAGWVNLPVPDFMNFRGSLDNAILAIAGITDAATTIYVGGASANLANPTSQIYASLNNGTSWTDVSIDGKGNGPHSGQHAIVLDGNNVIVGNDGGIWRLNVSSTLPLDPVNDTWSDLNSDLAIALVDGVDAGQSNFNQMVSGSAGNGLATFGGGPSWTETDQTSTNGLPIPSLSVLNGLPLQSAPDAGSVFIDPSNPNNVYAVVSNPQGTDSSLLVQSTDGGNTWNPILTVPFTDYYPFFPFVLDPLSPANSLRLLVGAPFPGTALQESLDGGASWQPLSSGTGWPAGYSVSALAIAGYQGTFATDERFPDVTNQGSNVDDPNTIYVSDGSSVLVTKDHGLLWVNVTPAFAAATQPINVQSITVDPSNRDHVFVVTQGVPGSGANQVWESTDAGQNWNQIAGTGTTPGGLPDVPLWQLVVDPRNGNLYVGTDNGVFETVDHSDLAWQRFGTGMPNVQVDVLKLDQTTNTLVAGTYGRSVYQLFLDTAETAINPESVVPLSPPPIGLPASAAAIGISGSSFWTGPIILAGDPVTNTVTVGSDGTQGLPNGVTAATVDFVGVISDLTSNAQVLTVNGTAGTFTATFNGQTTGNLAYNVAASGGVGPTASLQNALNALTSIGGAGGSVTVTQTGNVYTVTFGGTLAGTSIPLTATGSGGATTTVANTPPPTVVKNGGGDVSFSGSNVYAGPTYVEQGNLIADNFTALGAIGSGTFVNQNPDGIPNPTVGAALDLRVNLDSEPVSLYGDGITFDQHNSGALRNLIGDNTFSGPITLVSPGTSSFPTVTIGADSGSQMTLTGVLAGGTPGFTLVKEGTGTVSLTSANTYVGNTDVYQGALQLQNNGAIGSPATNVASVLDGGQIQLQSPEGGPGVSIANPLTLSGTGIFDTGALLDTGGNNAWTGNVTFTTMPGFAPFTPTPGTVFLGVTNEQDTLTISGVIGELPTGSSTPQMITITGNSGTFTVTFNGDTTGSLPYNVPASGGVGPTDSLQNALNALPSIGGSGGSVTVTQSGNVYVITFGGTLVGTTTPLSAAGASGATATVTSTTTIETGLLKVGAGTVALSNANTYTGSTEVQQGVLDVQNTSALGSRTTVGGLPTVQQIDTFSAEITGTFTLFFDGNSVPGIPFGTQATGGVLPTDSIQNALQSLFTAAGITGETINVTRTQIPTTTNSGPGATNTGFIYTVVIIPANAAQIPLVNQPITASGDFSNNAADVVGTTASASIVALGGIDAVVDSNGNGVGELELDSSASSTPPGFNVSQYTVTLNGAGPTGDGALYNLDGDNTWSGPVLLQSNSSVGVAAANAPTTPVSLSLTNVASVIDSGTGFPDFTLDKVDPGTLIFPANSTYPGVTITTDGSVQVDTAAGNLGAILLDGGTVSGTGVVSGITSNNPGSGPQSTINPGDNYPAESVGTLTSSGNVTLNSTDQLFVDLGVPASTNPVNSHSDVLDVINGGIDLGGASLDGTVDPNVVIGDTYTIIKTDYNGGANASDVVSGQFAGASTAIDEAGASFATIAYVQGEKFVVDYFPDHVDVTRELINVSMSLAPSPASPVPYGQDEQFLATVTSTDPGAPIPTGTVQFTVVDPNNNSTTYAIPINPTTGIATLDVEAITNHPFILGTYTVSASFNGIDSHNQHTYTSATAGPITSNVVAAPTTTTLALPLTAVYGQSNTFTATVATQVSPTVANTLPPQGSVSFYDVTNSGSPVLLGTATLSTTGGVTTATLNTSTINPFLTAGNHTFDAVYNGDGVPTNYLGSTSAPVGETIHQDSTTTAVTTSSSTAVYGQPGITFTAKVTANLPGSGTPTGSVQFRQIFPSSPLGYLVLGSGTLQLVGGVMTATYTTTPGQLLVSGNIGNNQVVAAYPGDGNFTGGSGSTTENVSKDSSTTSVVSSSPTSVFGQSVTLTATVSANAPGSGTPTGTVTFTDGATVLGTGTLSTTGGVTTTSITTSQIPVGSGQTITATYNGDGVPSNFTSSVGTTTQTVNAAPTTTTVTSSGPSVYGQAVTFTATVSVNAPGNGALSGTVTFKEGSTTLGTGTLGMVGGVYTASYTTSAFQLPEGANQVITATYSGTSTLASSTGTTSQTVNQDGTITSVVSSAPNGTIAGQQVTFTATVTAKSPGSGNPTGTVTFKDGSTTLGTGTLSTTNGVTTTSYTTTAGQLPVGSSQTITAIYGGDVDFLGSSGTTNQNVNDGTKTTVSSSVPSGDVYGEPVTFTATITPTVSASSNPTGTVTFMLGSTTLGTGTVGTVNGVTSASYTTTFGQLPVGPDVITAVYGGDTVFNGSSGTFSQSVSQTPTQTVLSTSSSAVMSGQVLFFTAQVSATAPGAGIPTGTVTFKDGTTVLGTATLNSGTAVLQQSLTTPAGSHTITATYNGDTNDVTSTNHVAVSVTAVGTRTSKVAVSSSKNPSLLGSTVTFTATVTDTGAHPVQTPTGTVSFFSGSTLLGTSAVSGANGVVTGSFSLSTLTLGNHSITAVYNGSSSFAHVSSAAITQTVNPVPSRTSAITLQTSGSPTTYGQSVTFTATVSDTGGTPAVTPTGTVSFYDGSTLLGTGTLSGTNGVATATFSIATLAVSSGSVTHKITAVYGGDGTFAAGNPSSPITQVVTQGSSQVNVTSSAQNGSVYGQSVTFSATVSIPGSSVVPTGSVTFTNQTTGANLGTFPLTNGVVSVSTSSLAVGSDTITASYNGDTAGNVGTSTGSFNQTVNQDATAIGLVSSTTNSNAPVTFTATVVASAPGGGSPTGIVTFYVDGVNRGTGTISGGKAIFTLPGGLPTGNHTIKAVYGGDGNFLVSSKSVTINFQPGRGT